MKKIIILSSDYHILRIQHIIDQIRRPQDDFEFYFLGTKTDYTKIRSVRILFKEVTKYFKTRFFLLFWSQGDTSSLECPGVVNEFGECTKAP